MATHASITRTVPDRPLAPVRTASAATAADGVRRSAEDRAAFPGNTRRDKGAFLGRGVAGIRRGSELPFENPRHGLMGPAPIHDRRVGYPEVTQDSQPSGEFDVGAADAFIYRVFGRRLSRGR